MVNAISRERDIAKTLKEINLNNVVFTVSDAWNNVPDQLYRRRKNWPSMNQDDENWEPEDLLPLQELIQMATIENSELT